MKRINIMNFKINALSALRLMFATLLSFGVQCQSAMAGAYPDGPIRFIVPFPAGGTVDLAARAFTGFLGANLHQAIVVENRPGAGSVVGTQALAQHKPDGYTIGIAYLSHVAAPLFTKTNYDPIKDFRVVAVVGYGRTMAVVPVSSPVRSLKDLVALAKSKPGQLNYLNPGIGTLAHLSTELLKLNSGVNMVSVVYKGLPPATTDLLADRLDFAELSYPFPLPFIRDGKLRPIAVMGNARDPEFPDVPTYAEQGFESCDMQTWYAILVPAGTPQQVIDRLNRAFNESLSDPKTLEALKQVYITPAKAEGPQAGQAIVDADALRIKELVKRAKLDADK
jgi:tripartite-type tricarboxylate transporter receptor subunit TctC